MKDPKVSKINKDKIELIGKYKEYFYNYFKRKSTPIYSKTMILDSEAVSYLVITSKKDEIKALNECFPFVGCFPYLGFFKKRSAKKYALEKESDGLSPSYYN